MVHNSNGPSLRLFNRVNFKIIGFLFYVFVFFPFFKLIPTRTDVQPYALVLAIFFFLHFGIIKKSFVKMPFEISLLFVTFLFSLFLFFIGNHSFTSQRGLGNYTSLFFISYSTYYVLKAQSGFPNKFLTITIYVWFTVGLIQTFIYRNFLTLLLSRGEITSGVTATGYNLRGVVGLAPEPTFYGVFCIFLLILANLHFEKAKQKIFFSILILIQLIVFSKSPMAILFLIVFISYYVLIHLNSFKKLFSIVAVVSALILSGILIIKFELIEFNKLRIYDIAMKVMQDDPISLLLEDQSIHERFSHIYYSFLGFSQNYMVPHGLDSWSDYLYENVISKDPDWGKIVGTDASYRTNRILSGYGASFFELGLIALLIPVSLTLLIYKFYRNDFKKFLLISLFLNTIMLSAIQLATPIIGFLVGYLCYYTGKYSIYYRRYTVSLKLGRGPIIY